MGSLGRLALRGLWPTEGLSPTREGVFYGVLAFGLVLTGLWQQINLILLVAALSAGPIVASFMSSAAMLRRLKVSRRVPAYVFAGDTFRLDYTLENDQRWMAALAVFMKDDLTAADRALAGGSVPTPRAFFARVPARERARLRWEGPTPQRGKYRFRRLDLITRAPFGLVERRVTFEAPAELVVYPTIGQLSRRWQQLHRQATETSRGQRHDRSAQQDEYHGLRDYRPGDSPRLIHWRTSARIGKPMIKEFEQQNEQDVAILLDPWLPRSKVTPALREALEHAIQFAATVCLDTCRHQGRRLVLGWTGATPGIRQGPASIKLLHELLEQLAVMRSSTEGTLSALFDVLPPATLRESILIVISTRPLNLNEEAERSARLSGGAARGLVGRIHLLDATRGDLDNLIQFTEVPSATLLEPMEGEPVSLPEAEHFSARTARESTSTIPAVESHRGGKPS